MVENSKDLEDFISSIGDNDELFLHPILSDTKIHPAQNKISVIFIKHKKKTYWLSFNHPDSICDDDTKLMFINFIQNSKNIKWVVDKKSFLQILPCNNLKDINLSKYLTNNTTINMEEYSTSAHDFIYRQYQSFPNINLSIPLLKHLELFEELYDDVKSTIKKFVIDDKAYDSVNDIIIPTLSMVERNGVYVDPTIFKDKYDKLPDKDNLVYTRYNLWTSTGRPSNAFDGINYAAIKKEDGSRNAFKSRYGKDGSMVLIDYTSFFPHIICWLTKHFLPVGTDIYAYLAGLYFQVKEPTPEQIKEAKTITFRQLFGGIEEKYSHIKYFKNLKGYMDEQWEFFQKNNYIETPLFKRKISSAHIQEPSSHKIFNYILQATEGEIAISRLKEVLIYLKNKRTIPVLYTYDSVLYDFYKPDGYELLDEIYKIMSFDNIFPMKIYDGNSYGELMLKY
jgi:DNA polymerase I-like protein with 3'-5' exonuclease and polymerase domains